MRFERHLIDGKNVRGATLNFSQHWGIRMIGAAFARRGLYLGIGALMHLCLPSFANAAIVTIGDLETMSVTVSGVSGISGVTVTPEGIGTLGAVLLQFTYVDSTPPAAGSTSTTNYNIFEPTLPITLSDTLSIVVTGITPTAAGAANVSVSIQFHSDSADEISPSALIDAITLIENGQVQTVPTIFGGVSDLTVQFQSDLETPVPAALPLFASGIGFLGLMAQRRKRYKRDSL